MQSYFKYIPRGVREIIPEEIEMDRRKQILNRAEGSIHTILNEAVTKWNARVFSKLRIADALDISSSGLDAEEYSYALKAHFDFTVANKDSLSLFAVEFDGPTHDQDIDTIMRDMKKESICRCLGMPLLRIDATYLQLVDHDSVLAWLINCWFLHEEFCRKQSCGEIQEDEVFYFGNIFTPGYIEDNNFVPIDLNHLDTATKVFEKHHGKIVFQRSYDPFFKYILRIRNYYNNGVCSNGYPELLQANDPKGYIFTLAILNLPNGNYIVGQARCRPYSFPPTSPHELSKELAVVNAAENMHSYLQGRFDPITNDEIHAWRKRISEWAS